MIVNCVLVKNEKEIEDYGKAVVFGIQCFNLFNPSEKNLLIKDISSDPYIVYNLAQKINLGQASDVHIIDIIENFISNELWQN